MKRIIIYILLIISFTALGIIGLKNQPIDLPEKDILNKELYLYNAENGNYETLKITKEELTYTGTTLDLTNCKKYTYSTGTGILKLDCNKAIRIIGQVGNSYVFKINNNNVFFYHTKEESYNGEFQRTFNTTKENYVTEGITKITPLKLDYNKLLQILSQQAKSYIYVKNKNCTEICNIYNNIFSSENEQSNKYYLEIDGLSEENLNNLNSISKPFKDLIGNETEYPLIIIIENGNIISNYEVQVNGLDFKDYFDIIDEEGREDYE